jgi:hypothetical protein
MVERTLVILGGKEYETEVLTYPGVEYLKLEVGVDGTPIERILTHVIN